MALRSSYWEDAHVCHGAYDGAADGFIRHVLELFKSGPRNVHQVANILIEFATPDIAAVESYFSALQRGTDAEGMVRPFLLAGR